jgi:hypothetical protein
MVVLTSAVAEQFLNRADVRTALQQVRCEAVSQRVRGELTIINCNVDIQLHHQDGAFSFNGGYVLPPYECDRT